MHFFSIAVGVVALVTGLIAAYWWYQSAQIVPVPSWAAGEPGVFSGVEPGDSAAIGFRLDRSFVSRRSKISRFKQAGGALDGFQRLGWRNSWLCGKHQLEPLRHFRHRVPLRGMLGVKEIANEISIDYRAHPRTVGRSSAPAGDAQNNNRELEVMRYWNTNR